MTAYPVQSGQLEQTAIDNKAKISGLIFFANDHLGGFVPQTVVDSFAARFYGK